MKRGRVWLILKCRGRTGGEMWTVYVRKEKEKERNGMRTVEKRGRRVKNGRQMCVCVCEKEDMHHTVLSCESWDFNLY